MKTQLMSFIFLIFQKFVKKPWKWALFFDIKNKYPCSGHHISHILTKHTPMKLCQEETSYSCPLWIDYLLCSLFCYHQLSSFCFLKLVSYFCSSFYFLFFLSPIVSCCPFACEVSFFASLFNNFYLWSFYCSSLSVTACVICNSIYMFYHLDQGSPTF